MKVFFVVFLFIQFIFYSQASDSYICPFGSFNINDDYDLQCYYFNSTKTDFFTAETFCNKMKGHLVSIHNDQINSDFTDTINEIINVYLSHGGVWLGLKELNGIWNWTDGTPFDYNNWELDEPQNRTINCASLYLRDGTWISDGCEASKPFSCIIPAFIFYDITSTANPYPPTTKITTTTTTEKNATKTLPSTDSTTKRNDSPASSVCPIYKNYIKNLTDDSIYGSQCYYFTKSLADNTDFYSADKICKSFGGNLVSIHNEFYNKNFTVNAFHSITPPGKNNVGCWIGGLSKMLNNWTWTDGTSFNYTNWDPQPQHIFPPLCAYLNPGYETWISDNCANKRPFSCIVPPILAVTTSTKYPKPPLTKITTTTTETNSIILLSTTSPPNFEESLIKWWIIGGVLIVLLLISGLILTYFIRRIYRRKKYEECQNTVKTKMEMSPLEVQLSYDERLTKQLDPKNVIIDFDNILGKGANATVYKIFLKGKIHESPKNFTESKKLKFATQIDENCHAALKLPTSFDQEEVEQFVRELDALIMIKFHPNIINFIGWTLFHDVPALITELADKNLLQYVKSFDGNPLPTKIMLSILWQISQALEHVASLNMVHRDVACRNILLTNGNVAKLADFGLCCHCDESFTYQSSLHKRLPLKWLSIEALIERIFSEKSDVWSFGILCFEIFSYGSIPFATLSNEEMVEFLQNGKRLEKQKDTPDSIYALMLDCWKMEPKDRPKFEEITNIMRKLLENETAGYGYLTMGNVE